MAEKFLSQKRAEKFHWNPVPRQCASVAKNSSRYSFVLASNLKNDSTHRNSLSSPRRTPSVSASVRAFRGQSSSS